MDMESLKKVTILYGTQTGNSEDVAERIGRQITRMHCKAFVCDLKDFPVTRMVQESLIVFVCSTTGNGEFPDDMKSFWRFMLRKNLPNDSLCDLHFSVLGLGDSSYEKFNVVAKKLNKRLLQLGAVELIPLTLADDQHELGYDAALDPWLVELKRALTDFYDLSKTFLSEEVPLPPKYTVSFGNDEFLATSVDIKPCDEKISLPIATLKTNKRVTADDHFQAVHLLEFAIDSSVHYAPGDVAVVFPENPKEEVDEFLSLLNVPLDKKFMLVPSDPDTPLPRISSYPCTVRQCVTSFFDIMSVPRRSFFEFLHYFSHDILEKEKLFEFTSATGQEELYDYCNRPRRTILEVLQDFPQTAPNIPFDYFFDMIPSIRPRSFSIGSSLTAHPQEFHLLVAVVDYKTRLLKKRKGLCSNWITNLRLGASIPFATKKGSIALPATNVPIIMVGPGTGCAPFRSFSEERALKGIGGNYLFFGSRYKAKDFLFSETWNDLCEKRLLTIFTAFSRDQVDKSYVQHRIKDNCDLMWDLIHKKNASVYVAGNAKQMPQGVKDAFINVVEEKGDLDHESARTYIENLEKRQRYQMETWA